jgi:hypothetical protein
MKKKTLAVLFVLIFAFAACGSSEEDITTYENGSDGNFGGSFGTGEILADTGHVYILDDPRFLPPAEHEIFWTDVEPFDPLLTSPVHLRRARDYIEEMNALFDEDGGDLWGFSLHVPIMFADAATRSVVASRSDYYGLLVYMNGLYVGSLPPYIWFARRASVFEEIGGVRWLIICWERMEGGEHTRMWTYKTEAFRWHQHEMFGEPTWSALEHMWELDARVLTRLEISALLRAARSSDYQARREHITNALSFRNHRRRIFDSANEENTRELWQGLEVYTTRALNVENRNEILEGLSSLAGIAEGASLQHIFASVTGALYAYILDEMNIYWKSDLNAESDLGVILENALGITTLNFDEINKTPYRFSTIEHSERAWVETMSIIIDEAEEILESNVFLEIPTTDFGGATIFSRGNTSTFSLPNDVWFVRSGEMEWSGVFGRLEVPDGGVISINETVMLIAENKQINGNRVTGQNWTLTLSDGFGIEPRGEGFRVARII